MFSNILREKYGFEFNEIRIKLYKLPHPPTDCVFQIYVIDLLESGHKLGVTGKVKNRNKQCNNLENIILLYLY